MSYRTHGDDDEEVEHLGPGSAAPTPYTPGEGHFFFSPTASPNPNRPYGYTEVRPNPGLHRVSGSTIHTQSTTQHIGSSSSGDFRKSRYRRTFSNLSKTEEMLRKWSTGVHWYVPTALVVVFLLGCLGAVGHHLFYDHLNDREATNQLWMLRYGTFLAFCTKAALVGATVLAYRQRLWQSLREKPISIRGLDALFSVVEDPTWFIMAPEMFMRARLATVMALATWLIPIASVLSPGALTTHLKNQTYPDSCLVQTVNFSQEADADWRNPRYGRAGYNIAFFNTTPPPPATSMADWFDQPSFQSDRITKLAFFSQQVVPEKTSPCPGFNCTYVIEFWAPWYNCSDVGFSDPASPLNLDDFIPRSKPLLDQGKDYIFQMKDDNATNYPRPQPEYNSSSYLGQGIFHGDPDVWFGVVTNTTRINTDPATMARWKYVMEPHAIRCRHQRAKYKVNSLWNGDKLVSRRAEVSQGQALFDQWGITSLGPLDNMERYKEFTAYYGVALGLRDFIRGSLVKDNYTSNLVTQSFISKTRLVNPDTSEAAPNFLTTFQGFYEELVLSFLSEPFLEIANKESVICTKFRLENRFLYKPVSLWLGYSVAIVVAFISSVIGSLAIRHNGMCSDTTFSKILVTTRNPTLDRVVMSYPGVALGGDPMPKELERTELKFGVVDVKRDESSSTTPLLTMPHTAFGLPDEIGTINKLDVRRAVEVQESSDIELGSRGMFISGAGLGALPG